MIFPTLECLSPIAQEEHELEQLRARGCFGPAHGSKTRLLLPPDRVTDKLQPAVEYRAIDIMRVAKVDYATVARLADAGAIERRGTPRNYRYSKAAQ